MNRPTREDLGTFLKSVRAGLDPVADLDCGRADASFATNFCPPERAAELAGIANRPLPGFTLYKFGSRSIVGSYLLSDGFPVALKYYYPSGPHKHLSYGIKGSRCHQSWLAALALNYVGIPTPEPLIIAEWQLLRGLWLSKSFLATRQAPGISLYQWVARHAENRQRLDRMADQLRASFSRMAEYHISHGDLKANNIIVAEDDSISFIDLDAVSILTPPGKWKSLQQRDTRIFSGNWDRHPTAATIFATVLP